MPINATTLLVAHTGHNGPQTGPAKLELFKLRISSLLKFAITFNLKSKKKNGNICFV